MALSGQLIILTPGFPQDENDTTCIPFLQQFALSTRKLFPSLQLTVLAFQYPYQRKEYEWHGVRVVAFGGANRRRLLRLFTWRRVWGQLNRLTRDANTLGIFSVWMSECALIGKYYCKAKRLKHYSWLVGQDARESNRYIKRIRPDGNQVIAFSDFAQEQLWRNFGVRAFCVACNGINPESFPALNTNARRNDILGAGSLIKLKNYSLFVEMVHRLAPRHPSLRAAIAGDGPERAALEAEIQRLGLQEHVRLLGSMPHSQVLELMNDSNVFLHPSTYEGNSTVLVEALYAGCRAVSFQGLSRSLVENLRVCENEEQMFGALAELLAQSAAPAKRVLFNSMDDTARKIIGLYI